MTVMCFSPPHVPALLALMNVNPSEFDELAFGQHFVEFRFNV